MRVQAEVSLYPLRTSRLSEPLETFCRALLREGIDIESGTMSTRIAGECEDVFAGIQEGFKLTAGEHEVVMVLKVSNACPRKRRDERG